MTELINTFEPITLAEMSSVKLMNRTDTKFVTNQQKLCQLLQMAQQDYFIQDIDGKRNMEYDTTYFDTTDYDMYCQHQWGHTNRQKIRFRTYVSSHLQYMEVKTKNNHGRTKKKRIEVSDMNLTDSGKRQFLNLPALRRRYADADTEQSLSPHNTRQPRQDGATDHRQPAAVLQHCKRTEARYGRPRSHRTETRRTRTFTRPQHAPTTAHTPPRLLKILHGISHDKPRTARKQIQTETDRNRQDNE